MSLVKSDFFLNGSMHKPVKQLYEFGSFQIDVPNNRLLRDGEVVALKPKVFDTLLVLVENSGSVLSKEELMEKLWPDTTVEENNLTQNISILRKVLGDSNQKYIATVPKRGYCFVAEIRETGEEEETLIIQRHTSAHIIIEQEDETDSQPSATDHLPSITTRPNRLRWRFAAAALAVMLIITGIALWELSRPGIEFEPSDFRFAQIADWKGEPGEVATGVALSPDEKMIAYVRVKNGQSHLWVQAASGGDPKQITQDEWSNYFPVWSPDSQELAFFSIRGKPAIYRIPFLGGSPVLIKEIEGGCRRLVKWSPERIYYEAKNNLFAINLVSNDTIQITDFASHPYIQSFNLSPDGRYLIYIELAKDRNRTFIKDMVEGTTVHLPDNEEVIINPLWLPASNVILYSSKRNGFYHICVTDLSGKTRQLTSGNADFKIADISSDGKTIFYTSSADEADLWCAGVNDLEEVHLTFDTEAELWPAVSPDSSMVAFQQTDKPMNFFDCSIFLFSADESSDPYLIIKDGFDAKWSPDGSKIAFLRNTNEGMSLWVAESIGGHERKVSSSEIFVHGFVGMPHNRGQIRSYDWSPDGKQLAYVSKESGCWNLCRFSLDDWRETEITNHIDTGNFIYSPLWSPDGLQLAYVNRKVLHNSHSEYSIHIVKGASNEIIFKADSDIRLLGWQQPGGEIIIAMEASSVEARRRVTGLQTVSIFRVVSGEKRVIAELKETYYKNIQLSPDRRTIAFTSRQDGRDNVWVLPIGSTQRRITNNTDSNIYFSSIEWSPDQKRIYYSKQQRKSQISRIEIVN